MAVLIGGLVWSACAACVSAQQDTVADQVVDSPAPPPPLSTPASDSGNPAWIDSLIARLQRAPVQNPPGTIMRYMYKGEPVYSVPSPCCDQFGYVYSASQVRICAPSGGITGRGDGRCPDFYSTATDPTVIWRETREWRGR
ncbi:MAG: hypothetical protein R2910_12960 [Gemmatimonadales bacterium]